MGLEPTTSAVTGRRSNQLSHRANTGHYTLKTEPDDLSAMIFPIPGLDPLRSTPGRIACDSSQENYSYS